MKEKKIFISILSVLLMFLFVYKCPTVAYAQDLAALSHGKREEKTIALTFDDGPHPRYTGEILDLLERYRIKATFFMIGGNVELYPEIAKRVFQEGHEIGSHTYSHPHMLRLSSAELKCEIQKTEQALAKLNISKPTLFRPPEGYRTKEQSQIVKDAGYTMVVWSLDTHDWKSVPSANIVQHACANVRGGDILLFHDYISGQNTTITALKTLIPKLLEDGYRFVSVSELIS